VKVKKNNQMENETMKKFDKVKLKIICDYSKTGGPIIPAEAEGIVVRKYRKARFNGMQYYWVKFNWNQLQQRENDDGKLEYQSTFNEDCLTLII
jgi:hypothetical protein